MPDPPLGRGESAERVRERVRWWARPGLAYRAAIVRGRWAIVAFWIAAAVLTPLLAPAGGGAGGDFGNLVPSDSGARKTAERSLELFAVPLLSGTSVIVHDPDGLSLLTRADSTLWALATTQKHLESEGATRPDTLVAAIPVPTGRRDIAVTYLFASPQTGVWGSVWLARQYAAHFGNQATVGAYVTGFLPAQIAQGDYLNEWIHLFEIASLVLIITIVAFAFRSLLAPLVVVAVAGVGYLVYNPLLTALAAAFGFEVPTQLQPVLLALLLGVVTDYCVLLFSTYREELLTGVGKQPAARQALAREASVVAVAGLTVAGGTIALLAAPFAIFRGLGPALALTVLVGMLVCLTLAPAVMVIVGWRLFTVLPVRGSPSRGGLVAEPARSTRWIERLTRRRPAAVAVLGVVVLLGLLALPLQQTRLDLSFTATLPESDPVARGADLLGDAGLRGLTAPTEVILEQPGIVTERPALARLQRALAAETGVARVFGPADLPGSEPRGLVLSQSGDAARLVVVVDSDPLAATAMNDISALERRLPTLAEQAGLGDAGISMSGQTLIASEVAELTRASLEVTVIAALIIELLILILYLRALVAPVILLAGSVLSVAAALGVTTIVFQNLLGEEGLTFYAPFAATILLIALGADYTVFSIGGIWSEAARRPLADALITTVPRTSRAITTAGIILAATFALVAIIPLTTFRQIALMMTVGLLIETLLIRPIFTPAVLTLLGNSASWPSRRLARGAAMSKETMHG